MDYGLFFLNVGFILNFIALAFREILWIRILLTLGYLLRFLYQYFYNINSVYIDGLTFTPRDYSVFWMIVFVNVNLFQIIRIVNERRKRYIEPKIVDLYKSIFKNFTTYEFLFFWKIGKLSYANTGDVIISEGDYSNSIRLILTGKVKISKSNKNITYLSRGHFVGEISHVTNEPAIADVIADGEVSYMQWTNKQLNELKKNNRSFWTKIQNILLLDMIEKIKRSNI